MPTKTASTLPRGVDAVFVGMCYDHRWTGGSFVVTVEAPPYHACAVRRTTPAGFADLAAYYAVATPYEQTAGGFTTMEPMVVQYGKIGSRATGEQKAAADGGAESLFVFSNTPNDPAERAKDNTAVEVRFVHQFMSAGAR